MACKASWGVHVLVDENEWGRMGGKREERVLRKARVRSKGKWRGERRHRVRGWGGVGAGEGGERRRGGVGEALLNNPIRVN